MVLQGRKILLIVGGGIAAIKSVEVARRLREADAEVRVILTPAARHFVTPLSFAAFGCAPEQDDWLEEEARAGGMGHIEAARFAELIVVAPATANLLARMANGAADDMATATLLASDAPRLLAPAMNPQMWRHPAVRRNISRLREDGAHIVGPDEGATACGEEGAGRMSEPEEILRAIGNIPNEGEASSDTPPPEGDLSAGEADASFVQREPEGNLSTDEEGASFVQRSPEDSAKRAGGRAKDMGGVGGVSPPNSNRTSVHNVGWADKSKEGFGPPSARQRGGALGADAPRPCQRQNVSPQNHDEEKPLTGKSILVTAGPTREKIDETRFLSNLSSGKQGYAIAAAAAEAGAQVTLIHGPCATPPPNNIQKSIAVETATEMLAACEQNLPVDAAIMTAAVADWRAQTPHTGKIRKEETRPRNGAMTLHLTENPDILATLARHPQRPTLLVGFALEEGDEAQIRARAAAKRRAKGCDWIAANALSAVGSEDNHIRLITSDDAAPTSLRGAKPDIARALATRIAAALHDLHERQES